MWRDKPEKIKKLTSFGLQSKLNSLKGLAVTKKNLALEIVKMH